MPKFTKLLSCDPTADSTVVSFLANDGQRYTVQLTDDARRELLQELQLAAVGQLVSLLSLTIPGHSLALRADGKALAVRTRELGTLVLSMNNDQVEDIQKSLAELLLMA